MGISAFNLSKPFVYGTEIKETKSNGLLFDDFILKLRVPIPPSDLCGDAPLPCTPYPNSKLRQIDPNNLGKGFYLEN